MLSDFTSSLHTAQPHLDPSVMADIEDSIEERWREDERKHRELIEAIEKSRAFPWKETITTGVIFIVLGWLLGKFL